MDRKAGDRMKNNEKNCMIPFPALDALRQEIEKLRTELSMLVSERDTLLYAECKNLEMQYMLTFGALEHNIYKTQCAVSRARRKLELIRAKRNRQEKILLAAIEAQLDREFAAYQQQMKEQIEKMNRAIQDRKSTRLNSSHE